MTVSNLTKSNSFLDAFKGCNTRVPVWFMRQAGRYLPQYQALKTKYSLDEMFQSSEIAAEVTLQPIDILGVDAAILFADILTLPRAMGADIHFDNKKGPVIAYDARLHDFEDIKHIRETIALVKKGLPEHIPLIGFAGSPFTVLTYLIEGGSTANFPKTFTFINEQPEQFHSLMQCLTKNTIEYFRLQKESGIDAFQLFDSWAGILRPSDYEHLVLPYVQEIFNTIDIPNIYFLKNTSHLLSLMDKSGANFLSVDHTVVLGDKTILEYTKKGIQGNLFNGLLFADDKTLEREVHDVLKGGAKHKKFIFNLNHGVLPTVDPAKLKLVVDLVHEFPWSAT